MKKEMLDEVIACLPQERTLFHYFKGQYAFHMLSYAAERWSSVSAVKQSPFKPLLNQPDVKSLLAQQGSGTLTPELFKYVWKDTTHEAGQKIKQVHYGAPPRSLYSDLPRKFCFQTTNEDPEFIKNDRFFIRKKRALKDVAWYRLAL